MLPESHRPLGGFTALALGSPGPPPDDTLAPAVLDELDEVSRRGPDHEHVRLRRQRCSKARPLLDSRACSRLIASPLSPPTPTYTNTNSAEI